MVFMQILTEHSVRDANKGFSQSFPPIRVSNSCAHSVFTWNIFLWNSYQSNLERDNRFALATRSYFIKSL